MNNDAMLIACLVLTVVNFVVSIAALSLWIGHRLSTHKIEWRGVTMADAQDTKTLTEKLSEGWEEEEYDSL